MFQFGKTPTPSVNENFNNQLFIVYCNLVILKTIEECPIKPPPMCVCPCHFNSSALFNNSSFSQKQRTSGKSGLLDPSEIERDPVTGLAIDGREQLMFLLSNQVMQQLVTAEYTPSEEEVTDALWNRFCEEADISVVSDRGA